MTKSQLVFVVLMGGVGLILPQRVQSQTQTPRSYYVAPSPTFSQPKPLESTPTTAYATPSAEQPRMPKLNEQLPPTEQSKAPPPSPDPLPESVVVPRDSRLL
jgi:hypothetical protein